MNRFYCFIFSKFRQIKILQPHNEPLKLIKVIKKIIYRYLNDEVKPFNEFLKGKITWINQTQETNLI
jgi:hypothetical protein